MYKCFSSDLTVGYCVQTFFIIIRFKLKNIKCVILPLLHPSIPFIGTYWVWEINVVVKESGVCISRCLTLPAAITVVGPMSVVIRVQASACRSLELKIYRRHLASNESMSQSILCWNLSRVYMPRTIRKRLVAHYWVRYMLIAWCYRTTVSCGIWNILVMLLWEYAAVECDNN